MKSRSSHSHLRRVLTGAALLLCAAAFSGCRPTAFVWAQDIPEERAKPEARSELIRSGDVINVTVVGQAALTGQQPVGADGSISLPDIGAVIVGGQTPKQASARVKLFLSKILQSPQVSVTVVTRRIGVSLLGEVNSPGNYLLNAGDGVANAIALAGGVNEFGDEDSIFLIRSTEPLRIRFRMRDLLSGGNSARAFALRDGDILVVE